MKSNDILNHYIEVIKPYLNHPNLMEVCFNEEGVAKLEVAGCADWVVKNNPLLTYRYWHGFNTLMANTRKLSFDEVDSPIVSGELPGGYRWQAFVSNYYVASGFDVSIRAPGKCFSLESFGVSGAMQELIVNKIKAGARVLISGGTSSGKSSLTNWLLTQYPESMRVQSVEDAHELVIPHKHQSNYFIDRNTKGGAPVSCKEIVEHMSRSRPDLIIVGEVSVENTVTVMRLFNEGKPAIATVHANSPERAIGEGGALEANLLIGGYGQGSAQSIIEKFYHDIDVLIQVNSVGKQRKKRVTHVVFPSEGESFEMAHPELSTSRDESEKLFGLGEAIANDPNWVRTTRTAQH